MPRYVRLASVLLSVTALLGHARAQGTPDFERAPINYSQATPNDEVARLLKKIAHTEVSFTGSDNEVLRTVLQALNIPIESQIVVFSRTSLQAGLIRPSRPRALYFSDSVYLGWVPGGLIEVAAIDPILGPIFYSFDPEDARDRRRSFVRETSCLRCHGGTFVRDIPGIFARSVFPSENGDPLLRHGTEIVDDETPFERRWGGWYVTGYTGTQPHRGNTFGREVGDRLDFKPSEQRPAELTSFFDTTKYLAPTSDMVALLVFEHQLAMHNSLTSAGQRARRMIDYQHALQKSAKEPITDEPTYDSVKSVFASVTEDVLDHLLFRQAAPLPEGIQTNAAFALTFAKSAQRDQRGDSLKDLSLHGRLFTHRCSFLIYTEAVTALPVSLKEQIFTQLDAVLRSADPRGRYAYLEPEEKRRIREILMETHPEAQRYFQPAIQR